MEKTFYGKTPNGGEYTKAFYLDAEGKPTNEENAAKIMIHEYTKDGKLILETLALTNNKATPND